MVSCYHPPSTSQQHSVSENGKLGILEPNGFSLFDIFLKAVNTSIVHSQTMRLASFERTNGASVRLDPIVHHALVPL